LSGEQTGGLSAGDRDQLTRRGIDAREAVRQLRLLREPPPPRRLLRPATVGDGVRRVGENEQESLRAVWREAVATGGATKLVPASGAASRMFASLIAALDEQPFPKPAEIARRAAAGDARARDVERLWRELPRFPFFDDLAAVCAARGTPLAELRERRDGRTLLRRLLTDAGLGLASLPKGLVPFHHYRGSSSGSGSRTAAEEHLWEGALYLADGEGVARVHYTVAPEALDAFAAELAGSADRLLRAHGVVAEVTFSTQDASTDTLAATPEGEPFRQDDGSLLLRPGGHGALLGNLAALPCRWALVKNIDNVRPESAHELVSRWQEVIGGLLVELERKAHEHLRRLRRDAGDEATAGAHAFLVDELSMPPAASALHVREQLIERLDRPLRVCGVVENQGEPGGGPFWVARDGGASLQIVERAEVDAAADQQAVYASSTHFNPAQIAAGLHDADGRPFELARYVDDDAVFIARKSHAGRELLALERPGLWNGSMARWNTVFVEVPAATFAPVKTVFDLLRPEHQP
jgi:uncharacterized protein DUF4301